MKTLNTRTIFTVFLYLLINPKSVLAENPCIKMPFGGHYCQSYRLKMPLLNQNNPQLADPNGKGGNLLPEGAANSQLCVPTSGAMALDGILGEFSNPKVAGGTGEFQKLSHVNKIRFEAADMHTDPLTGTSFSAAALSQLLRTFEMKLANLPVEISYTDHSISMKDYLEAIKTKKLSAVINIGHYIPLRIKLGKQVLVILFRNGGHALAVHGGIENHVGLGPLGFLDVSLLDIYDPWYGVNSISKTRNWVSSEKMPIYDSLGNPMGPFTTLESGVDVSFSNQKLFPSSEEQLKENQFKNGQRFEIIEGVSQFETPYSKK